MTVAVPQEMLGALKDTDTLEDNVDVDSTTPTNFTLPTALELVLQSAEEEDNLLEDTTNGLAENTRTEDLTMTAVLLQEMVSAHLVSNSSEGKTDVDLKEAARNFTAPTVLEIMERITEDHQLKWDASKIPVEEISQNCS